MSAEGQKDVWTGGGDGKRMEDDFTVDRIAEPQRKQVLYEAQCAAEAGEAGGQAGGAEGRV
jgi:hypothetical protein